MAENRSCHQYVKTADRCRVFFRNLPDRTRASELRDVIAPYSTVTQVRLIQPLSNSGFATFPTAERARAMIKAARQGLVAIRNQMIHAEQARPPKQKTGPVAAVLAGSSSAVAGNAVKAKPLVSTFKKDAKLVSCEEQETIAAGSVSDEATLAEGDESNSPIDDTYLSSLPLELWFKIFDNCDAVSVVRSRRVTKLFKLLAEVYLKGVHHFVFPTIRLPSRYFTQAYDIHNRTVVFTSNELSAVIALLDVPNLMSLDMSEGKISAKALTKLMAQCKSLRALKVRGDELSSLTRLPKDSLVSLSCDFTKFKMEVARKVVEHHETSLRKLTLLHIVPFQLILPTGLEELKISRSLDNRRCPLDLRNYDFPNLTLLDIDMFRHVALPPSLPKLTHLTGSTRSVEVSGGDGTLATACPQLQELNFGEYDCLEEKLLAGHLNLRTISCGIGPRAAHYWTNMESIYGHASNSFDENDFRDLIAANNKTLKLLYIGGLRDISNGTLIEAIEMCENITLFHIDDIPDNYNMT